MRRVIRKHWYHKYHLSQRAIFGILLCLLLSSCLTETAVPIESAFSVEISDDKTAQVTVLLKKEGLTMDDFHYMMLKNVNALTETEKAKLARIRNAMPKPDANTVMQKVIPADDIDKYINPQTAYYKRVGGSVSVASDTKHLKSFEDYYYGLRLDYTNTQFHLSRNSCGVIRFTSDEVPTNIFIPTSNDWEYPFTAHGFTSGNNGRLGVPEWRLSKNGVEFQEGFEIWEIFNDGTEKLRAIYDENLKQFIRK